MGTLATVGPDEVGGVGAVLPVSREVHTPDVNAGAGPKWDDEGGGGGAAVDGGWEGATAVCWWPAVAHPPCEDEATGAAAPGSVEPTVAHPVFLKPVDVGSPVDGAATSGAAGFAILMPAAFAIFRSSFSSRFLSFSFRLSISS